MKQKTGWVMLTLMSLAGIVKSQSRPPLPAAMHKIIVIAHRGDHVDVPENTLAAYENAIEHGADFTEIDLRTTKDGELVIMHDATVDRMTNGKGKIKDLTYKEVKALKITDKNKPGSKQYSIPSFREVLNVCKNKIGIYLDFKDADPVKVYGLIKDAGMQNRIVVYLNKEEQYDPWRKAAPDMPLMSSPPDNAKGDSSLAGFLEQKLISVMDGSISDYNDEMLLTAGKNNVAIWLDVQNKEEGPAIWEPVLQKGIKGLQTDHPGKLVQYLEQKGLR
jgi:glycerophosphoryl diester phosphodiesterase